MSVRSVLVAVTALSAAGLASPAASQSIGRQMDLLKLEQQAGEAIGVLVTSDFKACDAQLPNLRTIMADPRFDRLRSEVRRPFLFSVIVCSHNGSLTLRTALGSLEQLAYPDYEILVVDDGSTDAVPEAAAEFRDVRYLRIEHSGLSAARNLVAMVAAQSPWAVFSATFSARLSWCIGRIPSPSPWQCE